MIAAGLISWMIFTAGVMAVFVIKENSHGFGKKPSDQAIFGAIIGGFYSVMHGLVGGICGAASGTLIGVIVYEGNTVIGTAILGAVIGGNFGPIFVAYMMAHYYAQRIRACGQSTR